MIEASGGLGLAKETVAHLLAHSGFDLLRQSDGFDRHGSADPVVVTEVHHAHRAAANFAVDLVTAELGFFDTGLAGDQVGAGARSIASTQYQRVGGILVPFDPALDVVEARIVLLDEAEYRRRLVELPLAFVVEAEVVDLSEQ